MLSIVKLLVRILKKPNSMSFSLSEEPYLELLYEITDMEGINDSQVGISINVQKAPSGS